MKIKEKSYQLYKFDWLSSHGYTMEDVLAKVWTIINHIGFDIEVEADLLDAFEEVGFNGEIYACFDEFLNSEFQDKEYIKRLLNDIDYQKYLTEV